MYQPQSFKENDPTKLHTFLQEYPFATVIATMDNLPEISHLPLLLDVENNCLWGHIAKANPLLKHIEQKLNVTAIFHGPHDYISPNWYEDPENNVPTWNYAVVHVTGKFQICTVEELIKILVNLQAKHETGKLVNWSNPKITAKLAGITGFKINIATLSGKFKLSQNRSEPDKLRVQAQFTQSNQELSKLMEEYIK